MNDLILAKWRIVVLRLNRCNNFSRYRASLPYSELGKKVRR